MNSSLLLGSLSRENYDEYIENVLNIFRLSSKESSIILNAKINNEQCIINLSIINLNGETKEFSDVSFKCDSDFYDVFLNKLVNRIYSECNIITHDSVNLDNDSYVAFRMITDNNDLLTIDGLSLDESNKLMELCDNSKNDNVEKIKLLNTGFSNYSILLLLIIVIILIFILIWLIIK